MYYFSPDANSKEYESSIVFLFKQKDKFILEYYNWDKYTKQIKIKNKKIIKGQSIFRFIAKNLDAIQEFNNCSDIFIKIENRFPKITEEGHKIVLGNISHAATHWFEIHCGNNITKANFGIADYSYLYENYYSALGELHLKLNTLMILGKGDLDW